MVLENEGDLEESTPSNSNRSSEESTTSLLGTKQESLGSSKESH